VMLSKQFSLWIRLIILLCAAGCGRGGLEIVPIEGTVTHNGEPVTNLRIYFVPTDGRPSWAISDQSGHFALSYDSDHKGAKVGTHTVFVQDAGADVDPTAAMSGAARPKPSPALAKVTQKYGNKDTSPLQVEIKKAERNFQLKLD